MVIKTPTPENGIYYYNDKFFIIWKDYAYFSKNDLPAYRRIETNPVFLWKIVQKEHRDNDLPYKIYYDSVHSCSDYSYRKNAFKYRYNGYAFISVIYRVTHTYLRSRFYKCICGICFEHLKNQLND